MDDAPKEQLAEEQNPDLPSLEEIDSEGHEHRVSELFPR
jgi:hypothetical protein